MRKKDNSVIHIRVDSKTKKKWHVAVKIASAKNKRAGDLFKDMFEFYTSRVKLFSKIDEILED